jgi:DNA-directed RNA polymerase specialized sigma24 family protein
VTDLIIGSLEREEAKAMGRIANRSRGAEVAVFLRAALNDYDVKMHDPEQGIQLANRFVSYLEILQALARQPKDIQAVMVMRFGEGKSHEEIGAKMKRSERTVYRWITSGLKEMAEIIWKE